MVTKPATPLQEVAERVRVARTFAVVFQDEAHQRELEEALAAFRELQEKIDASDPDRPDRRDR